MINLKSNISEISCMFDKSGVCISIYINSVYKAEGRQTGSPKVKGNKAISSGDSIEHYDVLLAHYGYSRAIQLLELRRCGRPANYDQISLILGTDYLFHSSSSCSYMCVCFFLLSLLRSSGIHSIWSFTRVVLEQISCQI